MATDQQIDAVRVWVGSGTDVFTDDDLDETIDRLGSVEAAAHEILSKRLADLLDGPATLSTGGLSISYVATIDALRAQIATLETFDGVGPGAGGSGDGIEMIDAVRADRCGR